MASPPADLAEPVAQPDERKQLMNSIIYIIGLVVVIIAILSFFGLG